MGEQAIAGADETDEVGVSLLQFCMQEALMWGKADALALGRDRRLERAGELATYFAIRGGERHPEAVWLILPPRPTEPLPPEALRDAVEATLAQVSKGTATPEHLERTLAAITQFSMATYDGDALIDLLGQAPAKTGVIVVDSHRYRLEAATLPAAPQVDEDVWSAHVHQLLIQVDRLCQHGGAYVLLDLGTFLPTRPDNVTLLESVGDVGLTGLPPTGPSADEVVAQVSAWHDAAAAGEVGRVVQEIEADASLSDRQRFHLKLEAYTVAGLKAPVMALLRENPERLVNLPAEEALNLARIAEAADDDDYAEALVARAITTLRNERGFEYALNTARRLNRRHLVEAVAVAFETLFPNAQTVRRHRAVQAVRAGRYQEVVALLAPLTSDDDQTQAAFYHLLAQATAADNWSPQDAMALIEEQLPQMADEALIELTHALVRAGARGEAIEFLLERGETLTQSQLLRLVRLAIQTFQAKEPSANDDLLDSVLELGLDHLARNPAAGALRLRLVELLGPEVAGADGGTVLLARVLDRAAREPAIRDRPPVAERPRGIAADKLMNVLEPVLRWLQANGRGVWLVGRSNLPPEQLSAPADEVLPALLRAVEYTGSRLSDADDERTLMMFVAAASAISPLSSTPDEDLTILRTAAAKLVTMGRGQAARDLAEHILGVAGERAERRRQALYSFADIYGRLGMRTEALVALGAAFVAAPTATWDEIWFETSLLFRLLRDSGMAPLAIGLLERARRALEALGVTEREGHRLEGFALSARLAAFDVQGGSDDELIALVGDAVANAEVALEKGDDLLPAASVLNALVNLASMRKLAVAFEGQAVIEKVAAELSAPEQILIRASGPAPKLADIAVVAASVDQARHAEDAGYDLRNLRLMTRRMVGPAIDDVDVESLTYAIEASADHAVRVRNADGAPVAVDRLLTRSAGPFEAAEALSGLGVAIVGMALFEGRLATVEFADGTASDMTLEPEATFSARALARWSKTFPYGYGQDDGKMPSEDVAASLVGLGVTRLPERCVLIADARLQNLPPNLLTVDNNYAGYSSALGVAPSLEWLAASRRLDRRGDGSTRMWIPVAQGPDTGPLALMREDVAGVLEALGTPLEVEAQASRALLDTDVVIVGAHGGLADPNRYFRSVTNDDNALTDQSDVADLTRRARVAILFVCSGGRIDANPESGMGMGLAHRVLARGCSAVIAPAWPVPFTIARPWLQAFLTQWQANATVLDACHAANLAVGTANAFDPKRCYAMTLYGDPFIRADTSAVAGAEAVN